MGACACVCVCVCACACACACVRCQCTRLEAQTRALREPGSSTALLCYLAQENKLARALYTSDIEPPISNMVAELVRIYGETPF